ncbi:MAG: epoxide hydrolase [Gammaproteobacteria bacterium]|nr:epoxide hydrolase [Gammaproteobacteria bacterium]
MFELTPFKIAVSEEEISDLKTKLAATRFPEAETVDDWTQGIPLTYMQEVSEYWQHEYDWYRCQNRINEYAQIVTSVFGVNIHLLHVESDQPDAHALVLTHGWPGSIVEFLDVIEPLRKHFHLVIPSLPGYGFSGKPTHHGWNVEKIANAWNTIMGRLGYDRYLAQGGDWGAAVTTALATNHSDHCIGMHTNMPTVGPDRDTLNDLTEFEQNALKGSKFYQDWDSGYSKQQSTRPQTLGYGLVDSPIGQAAWILEKFYQWTDCKGHPENALTRDQLLDNVMLYWLSGSGASSARLYWESFGRGGSAKDIMIQSGVTIYPHEIFKASERWVRRRFTNLKHYAIQEAGGHFAAFEQPELFVQDLLTCFAKFNLAEND